MGPAPPAGDGVNATSLTVPLPGALQRLWLTMSTTLRAAIEMWTYNIGERLGQAWGRAAPQPRASLKGKVCIVTGAESGIGFATSHQLARMGAHVIIASRNTTRSMAAVEAISKSLQSSDVAASAAGDPAALPLGHAEFMELDLSSLKSVRSFAKKFNARGLPLHLLICNAGIMAPPARQASSDGLELQFQVNFLSHWLLTNMLLAEQRKAKRHTKTGQAEGSDDGDGHVAATLLQGGSRVVMLSSVLHRGGQLQYGDMQVRCTALLAAVVGFQVAWLRMHLPACQNVPACLPFIQHAGTWPHMRLPVDSHHLSLLLALDRACACRFAVHVLSGLQIPMLDYSAS